MTFILKELKNLFREEYEFSDPTVEDATGLRRFSTEIIRLFRSQCRPASKDVNAKGFKILDRALPNLKEEIVSIIAEDNRVGCEVLGDLHDQVYFTVGNFSQPVAVGYRPSNIDRLLSFSDLKWEGVRPVIFLNCVQRCATLL